MRLHSLTKRSLHLLQDYARLFDTYYDAAQGSQIDRMVAKNKIAQAPMLDASIDSEIQKRVGTISVRTELVFTVAQLHGNGLKLTLCKRQWRSLCADNNYVPRHIKITLSVFFLRFLV